MKIKLNVGISSRKNLIGHEMCKIEYAMKNNVDYIANVSCANINKFEMILKSQYIGKSDKTKFIALPMYEACELGKPVFDVIEKDLEIYDGLTLHLSSLEIINKFIKNGGIVNSRGGFYATNYSGAQLELSENIQKIIDIYKSYNDRGNPKKLFIGSICRLGKCSYDPKPYFEELSYLKEIYTRFEKAGIDVELEVGGHIPLSSSNVKAFKDAIPDVFFTKFCLMGPIETDTTNGYDHINAALGAKSFAAQITKPETVCIITPAEHLHFPTIKDSAEGVKTFVTLRESVNNVEKQPDNSYSFATCNSLHTVINESAKYNRKPISGCGMCGKDQCPLRMNYYIDVPDLSARIAGIINRKRDIVVIGGPFTGKTRITKQHIMPAIQYRDINYIGFGEIVRKTHKDPFKQLDNLELNSIFEYHLQKNAVNIVDNPVKHSENVEWFLKDCLPKLEDPVIFYIKRTFKHKVPVYWNRKGHHDKETLKEKIFEWNDGVQEKVEKMLCSIDCERYIIENNF